MRKSTMGRRKTRIRHPIIDESDVLGVSTRLKLTFGLFSGAGSLALLCFLIAYTIFESTSLGILFAIAVSFVALSFTPVIIYTLIRFRCRQCGRKSVQVLSFVVGHKAKCLNCGLQ